MERVLVADDQIIIHKLLAEVLKDDFDVKFASGGEEAVEIAGDFKPHVILLDVGLGDKDGTDVIPELKEKVPECIIILLTGDAESFSAKKALSSGAYSVIEKPFDILKLGGELKKILMEKMA